MKFWHLLYVLPVALIVWGFFLGVTSPQEHATVIRLAHSLNETHPVHRAMAFMAEDLLKRSGGKLRIEIYPNEQLGPERDVIEQLQFGSLGMTKVSSAPLESFSPQMSIFSLPYLFRDREHFWKVLDGDVGRQLLDASKAFRLKGLCYYDAGARSFYINKKRSREVRTPNDLQGLSIRVQKSQTAVRLIEVLGGKAVPIPFGELYSALDTGTVDGAENNPPSLLTSKQYEVSFSYCLDEHTRVPDILLISLDVWARLSPEEQAWLQASASASSEYQRKLWADAEEEAMKAFEEAGVRVIRDVDKQAFRVAGEQMYRDSEFKDPAVQELIRKISAVQ